MRIGGAALLLLLAAAAGGCSSVLATLGPPDDLSVLQPGATRAEVERELGSPRTERETAAGVDATYRVRLGERGSPVGNAADLVAVFGESGPIIATPGPVGKFLRLVVAVPVVVGKDIALSAREVSRLSRGKRQLTVSYDGAGRVVRFTAPAPY